MQNAGKMIYRKFICHLESKDIIIEGQGGFRSGRSTTYQKIKLKNHIQEGYKNQQYTIAIFFEIEKAYDSV